jgi:hypothetical protein
MNAGFAINKSNIDNCEKSLQEHLDFFERWRAEKNSKWSFIAVFISKSIVGYC